jgi:hypothetical protein
MLDTMEISYRLDEYTDKAKGIAFDTCHKIYVLMDDEQVALMREYGYEKLITSDEMNADELRQQVMDWYHESCGLRFINAVSSDKSFGDDGWVTIIGQGEDSEDDDE